MALKLGREYHSERVAVAADRREARTGGQMGLFELATLVTGS